MARNPRQSLLSQPLLVDLIVEYTLVNGGTVQVELVLPYLPRRHVALLICVSERG